MPRYFFNIHDGDRVLEDEEGLEIVDFVSARQAALRSAGEMLRDKSDSWNGEPWSMTMRDEAGIVLFKMTFSAG